MTSFVNGTNLQIDPTDPAQATVKGITVPNQPQVQPNIAPIPGTAPAPAQQVPQAPTPSAATAGIAPAPPVNQELPGVQDTGVASRVASLTGEDSPLMKQARTSGLQAANARGLLSSSIGIGASEDAAYRVALPIAQQEAAQAQQSNQQRYDLSAQMDRLRAQAGYDTQARAENYGYTAALNTQSYAYQAQQQQNANQFAKDMAAVQQGYTVDLQNLQYTLSSKLQSEGNTQQLQRMQADYGNQLGLQNNQALNTIQQIKASGDVQLNLQANQFQEALKELSLTLNEQNSVAMANAAVNLFQSEAGIRAALLSNDTIPAAERAAYEQQISQITAPTRNYISAVLGYIPGGGSTPSPTPSSVVAPAAVAPAGGGIAPVGGAGPGSDYYRAQLQ
jgi:hypothetical protein